MKYFFTVCIILLVFNTLAQALMGNFNTSLGYLCALCWCLSSMIGQFTIIKLNKQIDDLRK